jgi:hypothetical protein
MPSIAYVHRFIATATFTVFVETTILFFLMRYVFKNKEISSSRLLFAGLFASYATNPYVFFVFPRIATWPYNTALAVSETLVFLVEALFYHEFLKTDWRTSFILSLVCNFSSWYLTLLLRTNGVSFYW